MIIMYYINANYLMNQYILLLMILSYYSDIDEDLDYELQIL